jgi:hypothetical protein
MSSQPAGVRKLRVLSQRVEPVGKFAGVFAQLNRHMPRN